MSDFSFGSILKSGFSALQQNTTQVSGLLPAQQGVGARVQQFLLHPSTNPSAYLIADLHQVLVDPSMVQRVLVAARSGARLGANVPNGQNLNPRQLIAHPNFDCSCPSPPKTNPKAEPKGPVIKKIETVERQANKTLSESKAGVVALSEGAEQTLEKTGDAIQESVDGVEEGFGHFGKMFASLGGGLRSLGLGNVVDAVEPVASDVKQTAEQVDAALDTANDTVQASLHEAAEKIDGVADAIEDKIDIAAKKTKQFFKDVKTAPITKIADRFGAIVVEEENKTKPANGNQHRKRTRKTSHPPHTNTKPKPASHHHKPKPAPHVHKSRRHPPRRSRRPGEHSQTTRYGKLLRTAAQLCAAIQVNIVNLSEAQQILRAEAARLIPNRELRELLLRVASERLGRGPNSGHHRAGQRAAA